MVKAGKPGEAIAVFFGSMELSPEFMENIKKTPDWEVMEGVGHTLVYEYAILGDGTIPVEEAKKVVVPTLVMDGEKSLDFFHKVAIALSKAIPNAQRKTLANQTHEVSAEALAPALIEFFKS